ncbi:hypothetical protein RDI58_020780 [Solanum bulbocastanum]|uniref:Uncharacterized protein n=1 Tax=Solanum bulbocastanum TaxID=147425 RepID=A0AAN8T7R9_SOLBU
MFELRYSGQCETQSLSLLLCVGYVGTTRRMELEMSKMRSTSLDTIKETKRRMEEAEDSCNSMATVFISF